MPRSITTKDHLQTVGAKFCVLLPVPIRSLSSNSIGNKGAKELAAALRTNSSLTNLK
jgi:hypothetical protein